MSVVEGLENRPYQQIGIEFLREKHKGMILDEAGLGKTFQAICAAVVPVLVACPSYLKQQWRTEILKVYPLATVEVCEDSWDDREDSIAVHAEWTIINIEMFRNHDFKRIYETLIIDEAHHVRGHSAKQAQKARTLARHTPNVFLLTATPIKREVDDLFMQLSILDYARFPSYNDFLEEYCVTVDTEWGVKVIRPKNPERLRAIMKEYSIRRTYKETGVKRPKPIHTPIALTPSQDWYKTYTTLRRQYRLQDVTFDTAGAMIRALRALTFDLKAVVAKRIALDNPSTIFYVFYRDAAATLGDILGLPVIDGSMLPKRRADIAKSGSSIIATVSSLSEGIDLAHLSTAVFVETSYIPGDRVQAEARLVRWNKDIHPVRIFNLSVKRTIDTIIEDTVSGRTVNEQAILRQELANEDA